MRPFARQSNYHIPGLLNPIQAAAKSRQPSWVACRALGSRWLIVAHSLSSRTQTGWLANHQPEAGASANILLLAALGALQAPSGGTIASSVYGRREIVALPRSQGTQPFVPLKVMYAVINYKLMAHVL